MRGTQQQMFDFGERVHADRHFALGSNQACFLSACRWCKGGMQIWFSRRNWWIRTDISLLQKIIWSISCWGYLTHSISCPVFLLIPVIGIWLRIFPLENNIW